MDDTLRPDPLRLMQLHPAVACASRRARKRADYAGFPTSRRRPRLLRRSVRGARRGHALWGTAASRMRELRLPVLAWSCVPPKQPGVTIGASAQHSPGARPQDNLATTR
jgi:hypothetical protein